jgi:hypothetical protein
MDNGKREDFSLVFNGENSPDSLEYTVENLTAGRPYRFYVEAVNFVATGLPSDVTTVYACSEPGEIPAPVQDGQ